MIFKNSHFLTTILTPALRVWLSSQLDTIEGLQLHLTSSDQQILRGIIPAVSLQSDFAIYQGLHFDQISLSAEEISVNIGQIFKGQPLQILKPIPVTINLRITEEHLNQSLSSSLLQSGLQDFLSLLLETDSLPSFHWEKIILQEQQFLLKGKSISFPENPIFIQGKVSLKSPQDLLIDPIQVQGLNLEKPLSPVPFNFGSPVDLDRLNVTPDGIFIQGKLRIEIDP